MARTIGDGVDTKVWGWAWLYDSVNPFLQTPVIDELKEATVCSLFDGHGNWDLEILHDLFEPVDVQRVLATPISLHSKDYWRWLGDIRGVYTIKIVMLSLLLRIR